MPSKFFVNNGPGKGRAGRATMRYNLAALPGCCWFVRCPLMLSYSRGPDKPLWEYRISQVLDRAVERWGDCLALVSCHQSRRYSWRELRQAADTVASGLHCLGIRA